MRKFLAATLLLIGMLCLMYPCVAIFAGNLRSLEVARAQQDYQTKLAAQPDRSKALLDDARAYNSTLSGVPILDLFFPAASPVREGGVRRTFSAIDYWVFLSRH